MVSLVYKYVKDVNENQFFPPKEHSEEQAQATVNELIAGNPALYGVPKTRWTLETLLPVVQEKGYRVSTISGLSQLLSRLGLRWIRARYALRSPDQHYQAKLDYIEQVRKNVKNSQGLEILLYMDECSYYLQPTLSSSWTTSKHTQEKVKRSYCKDTMTRVLGTIDEADGRVIDFQAPKISVSDHASFYKRVCEAYPNARRIWIVQDNFPVHFHPNLLVALEQQENPFPVIFPPNWSKEPKEWAIKRFGKWNLPIRLVPIPTYAPWCNPIEKLWRKFRQDFDHMRPVIDDLALLRAKSQQFFDQFSQGSVELLRYVGLGVPC